MKKALLSLLSVSKTIPFLVALLFSISNLFAQEAPGGITTNLAGWYKANDGATPTAWTDKSTQGNNLTGFNAPTLTNYLNYNPVVTFNGSNQRFSLGTTTATWPGTTDGNTYYYVAMPTNTNTYRYIFSKGNSDNNNTSMHSGKMNPYTTLGSGNFYGTVNVTNAWTVNTPILVRTGISNGTSQPHYISTYGGAETTTGTSTPTYFATSEFNIGCAYNEGYVWDGDIAEVIVFKGKQSLADYIKVESYLAIKYGITKTGDYQNSNGDVVFSNATYNKNIFGIARDDAQAFNQKQSKSINSGFQPALSNNGILATTNAANTHNFSTDMSYLVAGSDNGSTNYSEAYTPTSFTGVASVLRMQRVWQVAETGTVGSVNVSIPFIGANTI